MENHLKWIHVTKNIHKGTHARTKPPKPKPPNVENFQQSVWKTVSKCDEENSRKKSKEWSVSNERKTRTNQTSKRMHKWTKAYRHYNEQTEHEEKK